VSEHLKAAGRFVYRIPVAEPVQYPARQLLIDPYLLGVWLGDGTTKAASITGKDEEIFDAFKAVYEPGYDYGLTRGFKGLLRELRSIGVLGDRHITDEYMFSFVDCRISVVQGVV